jgi:hypothetical protein
MKMLDGLGGFAIGALAMYYLDPSRGRTRRARVRDQLTHLRHQSRLTASATRRDFSNRVHGLFAELRARWRDRRVADDVLIERVRSQLGRATGHPSLLDLSARDGVVTVKGPILAEDVARLRARVRHVRGVRGLEEQLEVHAIADMQALQGEHHARDLGDWTPLERLLALIGGAAVMLRGLQTHAWLRLGLGGLGATLLLRGLINQPIGRYVERTVEPKLLHQQQVQQQQPS